MKKHQVSLSRSQPKLISFNMISHLYNYYIIKTVVITVIKKLTTGADNIYF